MSNFLLDVNVNALIVQKLDFKHAGVVNVMSDTKSMGSKSINYCSI